MLSLCSSRLLGASLRGPSGYQYKLAPVVWGSARQFSSNVTNNRIQNANLLRFVEAYRAYGHLESNINPLEESKASHHLLDPKLYGLDSVNSKLNLTGILSGLKEEATVDEIVNHLKNVYTKNVGVEIAHVSDPAEKEWLAQHVESSLAVELTPEEKNHIFQLMYESELFDFFMQTKFRSVKRYALEGCESMMPAVDALFSVAAKQGVSDVVIGMPHRGRLNLLSGLLKMSPTVIFAKAKGLAEVPEGIDKATGDVLSHLAISSDLNQYERPLHVSLLHNPSHLEAINPVTMGKARSKQTLHNDDSRDKVLALQIHGDAAFAGQGIVVETLQLSQLPGFTTGGSFHLIVNNQLGFTTDPKDGRSSRYSSDVGKVIGAPVFHVNADEPEDVVRVIRLAMEYRKQFKKDVIVDLIGYRRHGHNELDEPSFTQPNMYNKIRSRKSVASLYMQKLIEQGIVNADDVAAQRQKLQAKFDSHFQELATYKAASTHLQGIWSKLTNPTDMTQRVETGVSVDTLKHIGKKSIDTRGFAIHPRLDKLFCLVRSQKLDTQKDIDWATAEALAFGSLLLEGTSIRFSGQDVGRGTFSHRHLVFVDQKTQERVIPLNHLENTKAKIEPVNSNLSELAVMGFEYGYSINDPNTLVIWEAQFGDFANGAQIIIDQFISSSESKWLRQTGLVLLLPHGFDGAGPEHSSSHMERFLQLVDSDSINVNYDRNINLQVINPTTPANYFHALRRQQIRSYRKPMIVVSPKTLLRHDVAVSTLEDMSEGTAFQPVLSDDLNPDSVSKVVFCSGKYYYDLLKERSARQANHIALIRVEEIAPFPFQAIEAEVKKYKSDVEFCWVQEEHQNMGAWDFVRPRIAHSLNGKTIKYVGRPPCPATAVGISKLHQAEAAAILSQTFDR